MLKSEVYKKIPEDWVDSLAVNYEGAYAVCRKLFEKKHIKFSALYYLAFISVVAMLALNANALFWIAIGLVLPTIAQYSEKGIINGFLD